MDGDEPVEVELLGAGVDAGAPGPDQVTRPRRLAPLVAAALLAGVAALLTVGGGQQAAAPGSTTEPPTPQATSIPATAPATTDRSVTDGRPQRSQGAEGEPFPALQLLPDTAALPGRLVVTPDPQGRYVAGGVMSPAAGQGLWVVEGSRATARFDLPAAVPVLVTSGGLVYSDGVETLVMTPDTTSVEAVDVDPGPSYLLPGADAGELWALYFTAGGEASASRISMGGEGRLVTTVAYPMDPPAGLASGAAGGIVVWTVSGAVGLWAPAAGITVLDGASDIGQTLVPGTSGDLAALAEYGRRTLAILDVSSDRRLAEMPTANDVAAACFSPDRRYLALHHWLFPDGTRIDSWGELTAQFDGLERPARDQRVTMVDLADPTARPATFDAGAPVDDLAWAAPGVLVLATARQLIAVDVPAMTGRPAAELAGADRWSVASAADTC